MLESVGFVKIMCVTQMICLAIKEQQASHVWASWSTIIGLCQALEASQLSSMILEQELWKL